MFSISLLCIICRLSVSVCSGLWFYWGWPDCDLFWRVRMELVIIKDSCFSVQFITSTFYICIISTIFLFCVVMTEVMSFFIFIFFFKVLASQDAGQLTHFIFPTLQSTGLTQHLCEGSLMCPLKSWEGWHQSKHGSQQSYCSPFPFSGRDSERLLGLSLPHWESRSQIVVCEYVKQVIVVTSGTELESVGYWKPSMVEHRGWEMRLCALGNMS